MSHPIAVLVSGGGTTLENLAGCIRRGGLDARIACVVASPRRPSGCTWRG